MPFPADVNNPVRSRRHVSDCFLAQGGIVGGFLCRAAILPVSTSNTLRSPQLRVIRWRCWLACMAPLRPSCAA
jgi:hypothetical protein